MHTPRVPAAGTLPALRCYLGLTQTHLATPLGTTRGVVAQAEAARCLLLARAAGLRAELEALTVPTDETRS